jgi:hypothetical protein
LRRVLNHALGDHEQTDGGEATQQISEHQRSIPIARATMRAQPSGSRVSMAVENR